MIHQDISFLRLVLKCGNGDAIILLKLQKRGLFPIRFFFAASRVARSLPRARVRDIQ